jgi:glucose/arabinose dehydrogenase
MVNLKGTLSKRLILLYRRGKWLTLALADHFSDSRLAYLYHRYRTDSGLANKVIQVLYDGESRKEINVLLDGNPGHELYNGGRITIGPDGYLYVATGWAHKGEFA